MSRRKLNVLLDRGAVLFIGIAVGTVLGVSFATGGKPLSVLPSVLTGGDSAALPDEGGDEGGAPMPARAAGKTGADKTGPGARTVPLPGLVPGCSGSFPHGARIDAAIASGRPIHIGVFGDSFGDGVWSATNQAFRHHPEVKVHQFSHEGTGFTRYRTQNLLDDARARLAGQPIDLALISIGANDTQGLFVDGHAAPYMSEAWKTVIGERARALVQMLQQRGVAVGWVGLPRMRDADYDRDIQAMNRFFAKVTCPLGVPFANSVPRTEDGQHRFSLRLVDPATGKDYLARANDGKHMTFHGYEVITAPLVRPVLALLEGPRAQGPAPLPASVPVPKPPVPKPVEPSLVHKPRPPRPHLDEAPGNGPAKDKQTPENKAAKPSPPVAPPSSTALSTEKPTGLSTSPAHTPAASHTEMPSRGGKGQ